jgi:hypothetical protein
MRVWPSVICTRFRPAQVPYQRPVTGWPLGHLHFVADMLLLVVPWAFGRIRRFRFVRILHAIGSKVLLVFGLDHCGTDRGCWLGCLLLGLAGGRVGRLGRSTRLRLDR